MKIATIQGDGFQTIVKSIAQKLGQEFISAPKTTEELIQYSDKISPDNWCLDVKIVYGCIARQIEQGADTILLFHYAYPVINHGPCLMPWAFDSYFEFGLKKLFPKKKFKIYSMSWWNRSLLFVKMLNIFKSLGFGPRTMINIKQGFSTGWERVKQMDQLKELFYYVGATNYLINKTIYHNAVDSIRNSTDSKEATLIFEKAKQELLLHKDEADKLPVIGATGDLFALTLDSYPFFNVEEMLIREIGVSVYQPFTFYKIFDDKENKKLKPYLKKSHKYIKYWIGGSDYYTIPHAIEMKERMVDGVAHLSVFGCQPEMISRSVIRMIEEVEGFPPMLELTFDSHTQPEAIRVRLEAFTDMIKAKLNK
jgi:predicted nucleotide-binding protein (sugar kinase/HSP70/actin superfamily)